MSPLPRACPLSGLSQSESSLAEPSAHTSSPIHTKGVPSISHCRPLRRCSPEKQVSRSCSPVCFVCLCPTLGCIAHPSCLPVIMGPMDAVRHQAPSTTEPAPWRELDPSPPLGPLPRLRSFQQLMQGSRPSGITYKPLANSSGGTSVRSGTFKTRPVPGPRPVHLGNRKWAFHGPLQLPDARDEKPGRNQAFGEATECWLVSGCHLASGLEPWF